MRLGWKEALVEPCSLLTVSMLMCWCLDAAACNYGKGLLLMHARLRLGNDRNIIKSKNFSISG